jgi:hypothetical protein
VIVCSLADLAKLPCMSERSYLGYAHGNITDYFVRLLGTGFNEYVFIGKNGSMRKTNDSLIKLWNVASCEFDGHTRKLIEEEEDEET